MSAEIRTYIFATQFIVNLSDMLPLTIYRLVTDLMILKKNRERSSLTVDLAPQQGQPSHLPLLQVQCLLLIVVHLAVNVACGFFLGSCDEGPFSVYEVLCTAFWTSTIIVDCQVSLSDWWFYSIKQVVKRSYDSYLTQSTVRAFAAILSTFCFPFQRKTGS